MSNIKRFISKVPLQDKGNVKKVSLLQDTSINPLWGFVCFQVHTNYLSLQWIDTYTQHKFNLNNIIKDKFTWYTSV